MRRSPAARQPEAAPLKGILLTTPNTFLEVEAFVYVESQMPRQREKGPARKDVEALEHDNSPLASSLKGCAVGHLNSGGVDRGVQCVSVESLRARVACNRPSTVGRRVRFSNNTTFCRKVVMRVNVDLGNRKLHLLEVTASGSADGADADALDAPDKHEPYAVGQRLELDRRHVFAVVCDERLGERLFGARACAHCA